MDSAILWPVSTRELDKSNQQPTTWALIQTCNQLSIQKSTPSNSPPQIAQRLSAADLQMPTITTTSVTIERRLLPAQTCTPSSIINNSALQISPGESEKTRRARYAANQRHSRAREACIDGHQIEGASQAEIRATKRKQCHREKNKVAASKCRSRQRKQVQTLQEKGSRLREENAELKSMIQELREELN